MKARPLCTLSRAQKQAMDNEINRQLQEWKDSHLTNYELAMLYTLQKKFGWGKVRLERFYREFVKAPDELEAMYDGIASVDFLAFQEVSKSGLNFFKLKDELQEAKDEKH